MCGFAPCCTCTPLHAAARRPPLHHGASWSRTFTWTLDLQVEEPVHVPSFTDEDFTSHHICQGRRERPRPSPSWHPRPAQFSPAQPSPAQQQVAVRKTGGRRLLIHCEHWCLKSIYSFRIRSVWSVFSDRADRFLQAT